MSKLREIGWYWCRYAVKAQWSANYWDGKYWRSAGDNGFHTDSFWYEIGPMLEAPA